MFLSLSKEPETFPYRVADGDFNAELELCERGLVRGLIRGDLARMEPPASAACHDYESSECAHVSNKVAEAALLSTSRETLMGCTPTPGHESQLVHPSSVLELTKKTKWGVTGRSTSALAAAHFSQRTHIRQNRIKRVSM